MISGFGAIHSASMSFGFKMMEGQEQSSKKNKIHVAEGWFLPEILIDEILVRLPVKSLFRFKCVCKRWFFRISSPSFARIYIRARTTDPSFRPPWTLLHRYTCDRQFFEHVPDELKLHNLYAPDHVFPCFSVLPISFRSPRFKLLTSDSGLLLCSLDDSTMFAVTKYFLCNPVTKQWASIPTIPRSIRSGIDLDGFVVPNFLSQIPLMSTLEQTEGLVVLAKDGQITRFKVVIPKMFSSRTNWLPTISTVTLCFDIFCSEVGEWTKFSADCSLSVPIFFHWDWCLTRPFILNGTLHWPAYQHGLVVAYNPYGNESTCLHFIRLPNRPRDAINEHYRLCGVSCGHLQYYEVLEVEGIPALKVWELQDYDRERWFLKHSCLWRDVWSNDDYLTGRLLKMTSFSCVKFVAITFHPFDSDVMYFSSKEAVVSFNIQNRRLDIVFRPSCDFACLDSWSMLMPFVVSTWPTTVPQLNQL